MPKTPTRHRVKFHRHLKKVLRELNHGTIKYSSMSVVITESRELADAIHRLAKENNARRTAVYAIDGGWRVVHRFREHPRLHAKQHVRNARCMNGNTNDSNSGPPTAN